MKTETNAPVTAISGASDISGTKTPEVSHFIDGSDVNVELLMEVGKYADLTIRQAAQRDFHDNYGYAKRVSTYTIPTGNLNFYLRFCRQMGYLREGQNEGVSSKDL